MKVLKGPVYEVEKDHQYSELLGYMHNLKRASRPKWNTQYKHSYDPKDYKSTPEISSLVGPVYGCDNRHSYGHDYNAGSEEKSLKGPVYMDGRHSYGQEPPKPKPQANMVGPVYKLSLIHI